ncbi:MAG: 3-deoxy-manno-octulosonate cytidylyltransferase [Candidatus Auribacterota bacterium]|jgi:3-deoxy-manno-octulosonate cytidylyltransferase (CMP-KDO synthetase)|nr:3-deoxy-manno-octulosonate cytidylyltransferase [Candidatus Auribacterota bacterium]
MTGNYKVCGVIPARYDSSRFPGKPLALIAGKPMIQHVYERALKASLVNRLIVATDDERIFDTVIQFGGSAVMTDASHPSGTDRIAQAVGAIDCEYVLNIQGDEPLIDPCVIDNVAQALISDPHVVMATPIAEVTDMSDLDNPNVVKAVVDCNGFALYFSRSKVPFLRDSADTPNKKWYKHIGLYGFRKSFLLQLIKYPPSTLEKMERLEQLRVLENGFRIKTVMTQYVGIGVDTPEDVKEIEKRL